MQIKPLLPNANSLTLLTWQTNRNVAPPWQWPSPRVINPNILPKTVTKTLAQVETHFLQPMCPCLAANQNGQTRAVSPHRATPHQPRILSGNWTQIKADKTCTFSCKSFRCEPACHQPFAPLDWLWIADVLRRGQEKREELGEEFRVCVEISL